MQILNRLTRLMGNYYLFTLHQVGFNVRKYFSSKNLLQTYLIRRYKLLINFKNIIKKISPLTVEKIQSPYLHSCIIIEKTLFFVLCI